MDADLHVHTTASDGTMTPAEIVRMAVSRRLRAIALTDHDTVAGVAEAQEAARESGLLVIPGIEINTDYAEEEVHILGYWLDISNRELQAKLKELRQARAVRAEKMVARLAQIGVSVSLDRVLEIAGMGSLGRPHIAAALVEKGYALTPAEAFQKYLSRGTPGYVARYKIAMTEAVRIVTAAGGVPVLAHPGLLNRERLLRTDRRGLFPELLAAGIRGIEVYYPKHTPALVHHYLELCRRYQLIATGGSDYHGPGQKEAVELGAAGVEMEAVARLRQAAGG